VHDSLKKEEDLRHKAKEAKEKLEEMHHRVKAMADNHERQVHTLNQQLKAKDASLNDAWTMASDREMEIAKVSAQLQEATDALREHRAKTSGLADQAQSDR
jgi:chromosome segregation ATPase